MIFRARVLAISLGLLPFVGNLGTLAANAAQTLVLPEDFQAIDRPNDAGQAVMVTWRRMPNQDHQVFYELWMSDNPEGPFWPQRRFSSTAFGTLKSDFPSYFGFARENSNFHALEVTQYTFCPDPAQPEVKKTTLLRRGQEYFFKLAVGRGDEVLMGQDVVSAVPVSNWVRWNKSNVFVRKKPDRLFIRRIAGLEAIEEAVGRAAEMGKTIYFCHGLGDVGAVVTISALNILGKISERVAEYGVTMKVTCFDYLVLQVSQEMVREACIRVGRPDAYRDENIFYVSGDQFTYATAVEGMLLREKPAAVFFFGQFQAESLLLSETGAVTKAIQIAGTDTWGQIPFFITTCDYTLIGEELYAASAYLSREPRLLGSVKGQDLIKAALMLLLVVGTALSTAGFMRFAQIFWPLN